MNTLVSTLDHLATIPRGWTILGLTIAAWAGLLGAYLGLVSIVVWAGAL